MIVNTAAELRSPPLFLKLNNFIASPHCYLKLEGLNVAGSIKIKSAETMLAGFEKKYSTELKEKILVCSSSGNLAVALSIICKNKGYHLLCVSDPNISEINKSLIKLYGAKLVIIKHRDGNGGFLAKRIEYIDKLLASDNKYLFINQYSDQANVRAHYQTTAPEILHEIPSITHLFIGAGTTGTLTGCAQYFREHAPHVKIIAVDAVGSVTFGAAPAPRKIPGLGTSRKPELADASLLDDIVYIEEIDTIRICLQLLQQRALMLGGSTGTVLAALKKYSLTSNDVVVAISPDFGERYLQTVYNSRWVEKHYGKKSFKEKIAEKDKELNEENQLCKMGL